MIVIHLPPRYKLQPFTVAADVIMQHVIAVRLGSLRLQGETHARLVWGAASFTVIAASAGANYVIPRVRPTQPAGDYVVNRQVPRFPTTILTGVPVSGEDLLTS